MQSYFSYSTNNQVKYFSGLPIPTTCKEQNYMNFTFNEVPQFTVSYSNQVCPGNYSEASMTCTNKQLMTNNGLLFTSQFDFSSFTTISCSLQISNINVSSNATTAELEMTAKQIQLLTSTTNLDKNQATEAVDVISSITNVIVNNGNNVSTQLLTDILATV
uniref:Uncharacterized protein n=1 Tax=Ciona savignyi TaxID=51511 RepID=H2YC94_CIOSA